MPAMPQSNATSTSAEAAAFKAAGAVGTSVVDGTSQILVELLRASAANPIMAAATIIILADILKQRNIISATANTDLSEFVAALTAAEVIEGLLKQSVTTIAYGAEAATSAAALLGLLA